MYRFALTTSLALLVTAAAHAAPDARIAELAAQQKQPLLDSLSQLVGIESGSRDLAGLDKIATLIADAAGRRVDASGYFASN